MKAAVYEKYGAPELLRIEEVPAPAPGDSEVLVKVHAASVNAYDWHLIRAKPFFTRFQSGMFRPMNHIPGADIAGVVEAAGKSVTQWKPGDRVYGCLESCGKGGLAAGGFAEYACAKESVLASMPSNASFGEAAALPMAAVTALQGLRGSGQAIPGRKMLVNGASGGVGSYAVQLAKAFGAHTTAVCSAGAVDMVRSLGADCVLDYTARGFHIDGAYDLILDVAASLSVPAYRRALAPGGVCAVVGFSSIRQLLGIAFAGKRIQMVMADNTSQSDLADLNALYEAGEIRSVIDSTYPLHEAAQAVRHVESGHPKGKVVIDLTRRIRYN